MSLSVDRHIEESIEKSWKEGWSCFGRTKRKNGRSLQECGAFVRCADDYDVDDRDRDVQLNSVELDKTVHQICLLRSDFSFWPREGDSTLRGRL